MMRPIIDLPKPTRRPIRSNACFACKRRKIKCDQTKPECKKCAIHRIRCPGYIAEDSDPLNIVIYRPSTSYKQLRIYHTSSECHEGLPLQMQCFEQNSMQLIAAAAFEFCPVDSTPTVPLDLVDISKFNHVHVKQPALQAAIHTLALAQLGTTSKDVEFLTAAKQEYGRSLRLLAFFIERSNLATVWDEEIASAIVLLKFCESFELLQQVKASSMHSDGLQALFLNRGATALRDATETILFVQARSIMLFQSLNRRRRCFLEDPEWKALALTAPGRDSYFELQDIVACLPGLAETVDDCEERYDEHQKRETLTELNSLLHQLSAFADREWPHGSLSFLVHSPSGDCPAWLREIPNFGKAYSFPSWRSASLYCTWAVVRLMIKMEIRKILHNPNEEAVKHINNDLDQDMLDSIKDFCLGAPHQIGPKPCSLGVICSMPMLKAATTLLDNYGKHSEAQWCRDVVDELRCYGFQ